jgi:NAD(P)-dependent dehydrogenase (short-subunit alcohol dehydrogenase family)
VAGALEGHVAVITGSGGGIGREHALAFARAGARVVVNDVGGGLDGSNRSTGPADAVVAEIVAAGGAAVASYDSVSDHVGAASIVRTALDAFGRLDVAVNNASVFHGMLFDELSEHDWDDQIAVHVKGSFNVCKHALPVMVAQGRGRIVNTSSASAFGGVGFAAYSTAKAALLGLTYALAAEYWRHGITVNAILPDAGTAHRLVEGAQWTERVASRGFVPPGAGEAAPPPEFVPPLVLHLASDAAAHISGRAFDVGGGRIGVYPHPEVISSVDRGLEAGPWSLDDIAAPVESLLEGIGPRPPGVGETAAS